MSRFQTIRFRITRLLRSRWRSRYCVSALNALANDSAAAMDERALAVFRLFATYIEPDFGAVDLRRVFIDPAWLMQAKVRVVDCWFGPAVLDCKLDESMFTVDPFTDSTGNRFWTIYICLSTEKLDESEAVAFLRGEELAGRKVQLTQFALFSGHGRGPSRRERFARSGVTVEDHRALQPALSTL